MVRGIRADDEIKVEGLLDHTGGDQRIHQIQLSCRDILVVLDALAADTPFQVAVNAALGEKTELDRLAAHLSELRKDAARR